MLIVSIFTDTSIAVILDCDFDFCATNYGTSYACLATYVKTSLEERRITQVRGSHADEKTNADVEEVFIWKQFCPYLPLDLKTHFPNLQVLYIMESQVQNLIDGDLDNLSGLKIFDVSHNPIEELSRDFFKGQKSIEVISFYNCHLKVIHPEALDQLTNLKKAHFEANVCIDFFCANVTSIEDLKADIKQNCTTALYGDKIFHKNTGNSLN